jgi:hypothetical protein
MTDPYRIPAESIHDKPKTTAELLEEAKAKRANAETERIAQHNAAFDAFYLNALASDDGSTSYVVKSIPKIGKCLATFAAKPDHALFKRAVNVRDKPLEMSTCVTYSTKCVIFPAPKKFAELCDKYNVQGYEIMALGIHAAMQSEDEDEGKD